MKIFAYSNNTQTLEDFLIVLDKNDKQGIMFLFHFLGCLATAYYIILTQLFFYISTIQITIHMVAIGKIPKQKSQTKKKQ